MPLQSTQPLTTISSTRRTNWLMVLVIGATFVTYLDVLGFGFVNYDDDVHVYENEFVTSGLTPKTAVWAFGIHGPSQWHPLAWLSHQFDCSIWGLDAGWHHLVNLGLHLVATTLLFVALNRLFGSRDLHLFIAAAFALHPLNVESVVWIAERRNVLCGVFWMGGLIAYTSYAQRGGWLRYINVLLMTALALMSKPMAVTLPCVFLLLDYSPLRRMPLPENWFSPRVPTVHALHRESFRRLIIEKIPMFVISGGAAWLSMLCQQSIGVVSPLSALSISIRVENSLVAYSLYLKRFIWPVDLAVYYPHPGFYHVNAAQLLLWPAIGAGVLLAGLTSIAIWSMRRRPEIFVGWFWFLGVLVPMIGLVQVGEQQMADRYAYLAMIGLAVALVAGMPSASTGRRHVITRGVCIVATVGWSLLSWLQVGYWENSETLFSHALAVTEPNDVAYINSGMALKNRGEFTIAEEHYRKAIRIRPRSGLAWYNLGVLYHEQNNLVAAITCLENAVDFKPRDVDFRIRLGGARGHAGDVAGAINEFNAAILLDPSSVQGYYNLGLIFEANGQLDKAITQYEAVQDINPGEPTTQEKLKQLRDR